MKISIIVLAHNDSETVERCLKCLILQEGLNDNKLEIIFIPNGCTDDTVKKGNDFLRANTAEKNIEYKIIELQVGHRTKSLNAGLKEASGELVFYTNADSWCESRTISALSDAINNRGKVLVGCKNIVDTSNLPPQSMLCRILTAMNERMRVKWDPIPTGRFLGFKNGYVKFFPEDLHSEDNWIGVQTFRDFGIESIFFDSEVYFKYPDNWHKTIQMLTRWQIGTNHFLRKFPEAEIHFKELFRQWDLIKTREQTNPIIIQNLAKLGFSEADYNEMVDFYRNFIKKVITENALLADSTLVKDDGTWVTDR